MTDAEKRAKHAAYMREWIAKHRDKSRAWAMRYARAHKKEAIERVRLWRIKNRERWLARLRNHYALNRESERVKGRKYYDKDKHLAKLHKRRVVMQSGIVEDCSAKLKLLKLERFCRWCCTRLTNKNRSIDHIVPIFRGGNHIPANLAASCRQCNFSKGKKLLEDWLPFQSWST